MADPAKIPLIYVFDAYCGWCYGFGPQLAAFVGSGQEQYSVEVVSGRLFTGDGVVSASAMSYIDQSNRRIAEVTGAVFGDDYRALLHRKDFVMDSAAAARGFAALRAQEPERALTVAAAMQEEFYHNGRSLSDPQTYAHLARRLGFDADGVVRDYSSSEAAEAASADFATARALGVASYPTLLIQLPGNRLERLGNAASTAADLTAQMAAFRSASGRSVSR